MGIFRDNSLGVRLTAVFVAVALFPMLLLAYVSYRVMDSRIRSESHEKLAIAMKAAWIEYYIHSDQMRLGMLQVSTVDEFQKAVKRGDAKYLKQSLLRWKQARPYVDMWAIVDGRGRVLSRLNGNEAGDVPSFGGLVEQALSTGEPVTSTEIISREVMAREGAEFLKSIPSASVPVDKGRNGGGYAGMVVITPVKDAEKVIGAIITIDLLNIDNHISDILAGYIPGLFTTVSVSGTRISTNLLDGDGKNARGTAFPQDFASGLGSGEQSFREWMLGNTAYMSLFEPITDYRGRAIGTLDVAIPKDRLWAAQRVTQRIIALMTALGLLASVLAAALLARRLTEPLKNLRDKLQAYGAGDMEARVEVPEGDGVRDEITVLSREFNSMMEEVRRKEAEKGVYLKEIEEKNRALAELNEEMKTTNEELEVAYEETQSQTEELHAINEELKLLNEDLDRKNVELQKANRLITQEEEELKAAKDKLRLIYDSITDFIALVDSDNAVIEVNKHFLDKMRINEAAALGRDIYGFFGVIAPEDCPIRKSILSMAPASAELSAPDGRVLSLNSFPLIDSNDVMKKAVVYIKDVTEYRTLTNKLIQTDKLSSLGELVSGVAHELNNPLTGIMCFSELLLEDKTGEDVKVKLRKINEASHRCKKIIDNLLTFARWKRPEKSFESLNKVVRDSVELRAYQLRVDNIDLELDLDESIPGTMLDENQMQQVFLNLINNARDAIKEKGETGRIRISSRLAGSNIAVKVEDTGKGMSRDVAAKIFDPFFTTKGVGKGTGLGLSISYGIINEHGGSINASSTPGKGTVFTVEVPVVGKRKSAAREELLTGLLRVDSFKTRAQGLKALLLDDESIVLDLLFESLTFSGFRVDRSASAAEALEKLKESDYDLIISDIKMPGMDGKGFYREVRNFKPEALGRIIFISGDSVNKDTQEFLKETGNVYLKKPFTVDQLNDVISRVLF